MVKLNFIKNKKAKAMAAETGGGSMCKKIEVTGAVSDGMCKKTMPIAAAGMGKQAGLMAASAFGADKKAVIMTVEAAFAALIMFGILLLVATISSAQKDYPPSPGLLNDYSMDTLASLQKQGAFNPIFSSHDDSALRSVILSVQPSLCMQIEIYENDTEPAHLYYSYTPANCILSPSTLKSIAYSPFVFRQNSSHVSFYLIKAVAYPR